MIPHCVNCDAQLTTDIFDILTSFINNVMKFHLFKVEDKSRETSLIDAYWK